MAVDNETLTAHDEALARRDAHFQAHRVDVKYHPKQFYVALVAFPQHVRREGFGLEGITATGQTPVDAVGALWQWVYRSFLYEIMHEHKDGR